MSQSWCFNESQLADAGRRYLEDGPDQTRALRLQELDAVLNVLRSSAFSKLRVEQKQVET